MKHASICTVGALPEGRPFTGAWIETMTLAAGIDPVDSRPFTGAWIETPSVREIKLIMSTSPLHGGVD